MILYHGSNVEIEAIDFSKSKPGKDFGVGFYLSPDENQALEMAEKKARCWEAPLLSLVMNSMKRL